jgi:hypothetical protein
MAISYPDVRAVASRSDVPKGIGERYDVRFDQATPD